MEYPGWSTTFLDTQLKDGMKLDMLKHAGTENLDRLCETLDASIAHCKAGLELTRQMLTELQSFVKRLATDAGVNLTGEIGKNHLEGATQLLYEKMYAAPTIPQLFAMPEPVTFTHNDIKDIVTKLNRNNSRALDYEKWALNLTDLENQKNLQQLLDKSLEEFEVSDKQLKEFIEEIRKTLQEWKMNGLRGKCKVCDGVTPTPEDFIK
jgi:hypothetical protein